MAFNIFALLFAGKVVEKKLGSLPYLLLYHGIAVVNAVTMCFVFPDSVSVGASAGIFGMIGIVCVLRWRKDPVCLDNLKKKEIIYTDSWGAGHEKKRMPSDWAFVATHCLIALIPAGR